MSVALPTAPRTLALTLSLTAGLVALGALSLFTGTVYLAPSEVLAGILGRGDERLVLIVAEIRLPRTLLAALVGAALGLSGAALQGLLRNPLAEPGITGVSASAGLGAVIALYFGFAAMTPWALPAAAMAGALIATLFLFALAAREGSVLTIILAGIALSTFAVALTALALNLSPNPYAMSEMVLWLLGSVRDRSLGDVGLAVPFVAAGAVLLVASGRALDALALGEDTAQSLGISLKATRRRVIFGTALAVGTAVAVSGTIGFVGLVVPHVIRPLVGHAPGRALLPSAVAGACLLLAADIVVRLLPTAAELMLGVVTALIGAPFFLYLIVKTRRSLL